MKSFREKFSDNLINLIYVIAGIIMVVNPKFVCDALNYIVGSLIIVVGIIFISRILQHKEIKSLTKIELLITLLCIGLGLFLIFNSKLLVSLLPIGTGVLIFLDSISQIMKSFKLKKNGLKYWYINLIVGLLFLAFAIYIIVKATSITYLIVRFIGAVLIIDAIMEFYTYFKLKEYNGTVKVIETEVISIKKQ